MAGKGTSDTQAMVLAAITRAADAGEPAPGNAELCAITGYASISTAAGIVDLLERRGLIRVERTSCARQITVVATGNVTAWPPHVRGPGGIGPAAKRRRAPPPAAPRENRPFTVPVPNDLIPRLADEARQLGEPETSFIGRLLWLGWHCHVEAAQPGPHHAP